MEAALKKVVGKRIRLYTASGVESYIGTLTEVRDDYVVLRDDRHEEEMFIAVPHIESFHVAEAPPARRRLRSTR
jgi:ferredoxin-fold anticodon binding domain-containing protein